MVGVVVLVVWVLHGFCRRRCWDFCCWLLGSVLLSGGPLRGLFARPALTDADALVVLVLVADGGDVGGAVGDT